MFFYIRNAELKYINMHAQLSRRTTCLDHCLGILHCVRARKDMKLLHTPSDSSFACICDKYCKFGNFREDFIFAQSFVQIKPSQNGKITLLFIDIGKSCLNCEFFTSLMCHLMLFAKIKFFGKFQNLQYQTLMSLLR